MLSKIPRRAACVLGFEIPPHGRPHEGLTEMAQAAGLGLLLTTVSVHGMRCAIRRRKLRAAGLATQADLEPECAPSIVVSRLPCLSRRGLRVEFDQALHAITSQVSSSGSALLRWERTIAPQ